MLYNVEIHEWNENTPDNGIWQGDIFPDLTEANSEAEAIRLCIDYYMEEADWSTTDHDPDSVEVKADSIEYIDSNGDHCAILFRAERTMTNNLRALRKKAGMTQQELAEISTHTPHTGCDPTYSKKIESPPPNGVDQNNHLYISVHNAQKYTIISTSDLLFPTSFGLRRDQIIITPSGL